ncbi:hypothetical protein [Aquimarina sp. RZ0]|uniref:hypothetical protein n=1 Tax=Aquimarina sp. RZ0 TaxID=2607730 RepID=UPI0011F340E6|nr:hypothetical protein [Aquimarina sp. RZ0]KAA1248137.1 hypothetical protein F0000_00640 [Aquimarina sp. RZ0]
MSNSVKSVITNSAPPKETIIEVGKEKTLICYYDDPTIRSCTFYVYRLDGKPTLDGKKELIFKGRSPGGIFNSNETLKPKFSWFDKDEEEIRLAFDVSFSGERIPCKDQILIIKRGGANLNVYWEGGDNSIAHTYGNNPLIACAEFYENSNLDIGGKILFKVDRVTPEVHNGLATSQILYEESRFTKNGVTTIKSKPLDIDYFIKWFCKAGIKISFVQGFREPVIHLKNQEQRKIRRYDPVDPEDIYKILQADGLVPQIFYDYHLTVREILEPIEKLISYAGHILNATESFLKKSFFNFFKNYSKGKLQDAVTTDLFKKWVNDRNNHRFFKEELSDLIVYFNTYKPNRYKNGFRSWFVIEFKFNPQHPAKKKEIEELKAKKQKIWNERTVHPFRSLSESDPVSWVKLKKLQKTLDDYDKINQLYNEYEDKFFEIEKQTVKGLQILITLSPNSNRY